MAKYNTISRLVNFKSTPPNVGLVAAWNLENVNDNFAANNLTNNGGATFVAGKLNNAVNLDGVNDYLSIADNAAISFGAGKKFTFTGWFQLKALPVSFFPLFTKWNAAGNREYEIEIKPASIVFTVSNDGTASTAVTQAFIPQINVWYFLCCWYDGNALYLELNASGTIASQAYTSDIFNGAAELNIGRKQGDVSEFFKGLVDAVRLYKHDTRVLTANERSSLYNTGIGREYVNSSNIVASSEVNNELNQIINLFSGVSKDITPKLHVDLAEPALILNQNGNGPILQSYKNGVLSFEVNNKGQVVSKIATGIAPITIAVATTGLITNLNVDRLDGLLDQDILKVTSTIPFVDTVFFVTTVFIVGDSFYVIPKGNLMIGAVIQQEEPALNPGSITTFSLAPDNGGGFSVAIGDDLPSALLAQFTAITPTAFTGTGILITCTGKAGGGNNHKNVSVGIVTTQAPI